MRGIRHVAVSLFVCGIVSAAETSTFDKTGHGLVSVEVDGQVVQLLGSLSQTDRALGVSVRAGARLRIEEVDVERNRCTVSLSSG